MNASLDTVLVALAVLGALGFLLRGFFARKKKPGCASGCGCASPPKMGGSGVSPVPPDGTGKRASP